MRFHGISALNATTTRAKHTPAGQIIASICHVSVFPVRRRFQQHPDIVSRAPQLRLIFPPHHQVIGE
jgi:hypothetical protein